MILCILSFQAVGPRPWPRSTRGRGHVRTRGRSRGRLLDAEAAKNWPRGLTSMVSLFCEIFSVKEWRDLAGLHTKVVECHWKWRYSIRLSIVSMASSWCLPAKVRSWSKIAIFAARCYASAAYVVMRCLSLCVCPSRSCILSKRINIIFFTVG